MTFDTTRADHLGPYGNGAVSTPHLDRLAADGVVFEHAYTTVPITLPSHSTMMTGKVPFAHGVRDNGLFVLGEEQTTLAEILRNQGYGTAAAIGSFPLLSRFGIDQGFDFYDDDVVPEPGLDQEEVRRKRLFFDERRAGRVNDALLPWLEENHDRPFFAWAHYFDPHQPTEPPPPYDQLYVHDPYLGEIAYADESFGRLLDKLDEWGVADRTIVIFASDHGEGRGEHRESTHSMLLYNSTLHVPLIVRAPGVLSGERIARRVSTIDILPTVLELLGIDAPEGIQGISQVAALREGNAAPEPRRVLYAETLSGRFMYDTGELRALIDGDWKYIHGPRSELFDIEQDPRELSDRIGQESAVATQSVERLGAYLQRHAEADLDASVALDTRTAQRLQALGYLQSEGAAVGPIEEVLRTDGGSPQHQSETISALSTAKQFLFDGRVVEAREILVGLVGRFPGHRVFTELLASAEERLGNTSRAIALLEGLESGDLDLLPETERSLGRMLLAEQRWDAGLQRVERAEAAAPTIGGQMLLARTQLRRSRPDLAAAFLEKALELSPDAAEPRVELAIVRAQQGDAVTAEQLFAEARDLAPFSPLVLYNYGAHLALTDRREEAVGVLRQVVEVDPNHQQAHFALFEILSELETWDEAAASFEALHRIAPDGPLARQARRLSGLE